MTHSGHLWLVTPHACYCLLVYLLDTYSWVHAAADALVSDHPLSFQSVVAINKHKHAYTTRQQTRHCSAFFML